MAADLTITATQATETLSSSSDCPCLIVALDASRPLGPKHRIELLGAQEVILGRAPEYKLERDPPNRRIVVRLPDRQMSGAHARIVGNATSWYIEDLGSKNGTFVNGVQANNMPLNPGALIQVGNTLLMFTLQVKTNPLLNLDLDSRVLSDRAPVLQTMNVELQGKLDGLSAMARGRLPILIHGESGTGKELIARAIHDLSQRKGKFVAINCGALPRDLVEAELFGHLKGAFSNAVANRDGLVVAAEGGTLFLDEVAELPHSSQVALLRVLQEYEVRPVGSTHTRKVDVRVIAATHQDLEPRMKDGRFRSDLFARLAAFRFELPALRNRREDIALIVANILSGLPNSEHATFSRAVATRLLSHDYPLNVRELENALRSALVLAHDQKVHHEHLPPGLGQLPEATRRRRVVPEANRAPAMLDDDASNRASDGGDLEKALRHALAKHAGNVAAVARDMGKLDPQIRRWCKRFRINLNDYRQ